MKKAFCVAAFFAASLLAGCSHPQPVYAPPPPPINYQVVEQQGMHDGFEAIRLCRLRRVRATDRVSGAGMSSSCTRDRRLLNKTVICAMAKTNRTPELVARGSGFLSR
jgi:hypothetical protein